MKVYLVQVDQGTWDSAHSWIAKVFSSKALALHYIHKLQCVFKNCYDFYKEKYDQYDDYYEGLNEMDKTEEMASKWCYYNDKIEKFETPYCHVIEKELIGLK